MRARSSTGRREKMGRKEKETRQKKNGNILERIKSQENQNYVKITEGRKSGKDMSDLSVSTLAER